MCNIQGGRHDERLLSKYELREQISEAVGSFDQI